MQGFDVVKEVVWNGLPEGVRFKRGPVSSLACVPTSKMRRVSVVLPVFCTGLWGRVQSSHRWLN